MECQKCHAENPENNKFCRECGVRLLKICPKCGSKSLPADKFCGECGNKFGTFPISTYKDLSYDEKLAKIKRYLPKDLVEKILSQREKIEGEQKQVTVMFCDMEGFTALSEHISPEDAYSIMDRVYEILIHGVHEYEGTVNEMTGDGIMALFGAPIAMEDAPQRAIRSAHAIHREMARFNDRIKREKGNVLSLRLRIGVHTGPVVVGTLGNDLRMEFKAVGDTVNLASRVEGLAEPGTTYVTEDTFKLTEGMFRFEAFGEKRVKGRKEPVKVYRVIAPSTRRTRFDISAERGLTPFVGRERELELLLDGFERVKGGRGQAFSIMAEAGVGKSRLLYEFRKVVASEDVNFLEGKCISYSKNVAYHPVTDILKATFEIHGDDRDSDIREKVQKGLKELSADEATTLPYLLELLSVKDSGIDKIPLSPEAKKAWILEALKRIILKGSALRPLIVAIEDLHWIDESSEEALKDVLDSILGVQVLLIFTYRPEFVPTWGGRSYHCQVNLNRLSNREILIMVSHLLGAEDLDKNLEDFILQRTEGVPFFIEEFIKSLKDLKVIEKRNDQYFATKDLEDVTIPSRIQDVIMARVDSLTEGARKLLQIASLIGREFGYKLINEVTGLPEQELLAHLSMLKDTELIYERGIYPESTYIFKHALTQDAVYQSLLKSTRLKFHRKVAEVLEECFPETAKDHPELLGHHFTEAALLKQAIPYWQHAGEIAIRRSAHMLAVNNFTRALELLKSLPETPARDQQELTLQIALYAPLAGAKGYGTPEVGRAFNRARELCEKVGDPKQLFLVLYGLWGHNLIHYECQTIQKLAEQCLDLARKVKDTGILMEAYRIAEETALYRGEFETARKYWEQSLALFNPQQHHTHAAIYGQNPGVALLTHGAWILWHLGYPDQAKNRAEEALRLAREWPHPFSLAFSLYIGTIVYQYRQEVQRTMERTEEVITLSHEQGFPLWLSWATVLHGWVLVIQGQEEDGISQIRKGLADSRATGTEVHRTYHLALLAEAYGKIGQGEEGLTTIDEALAMAEKGKQRFYEAELYRLKGQLLLIQDEALESEAGANFRKAIDVSQRQSARSLGLRATVSLSRLLCKQGKKEEAKELLSGIYSWFTEGFETSDLRDAQELLQELSKM